MSTTESEEPTSAAAATARERSGFPVALTEGLLVAGFTAFAYLLAFLYELGFSLKFHIPTALIDVRLPQIVIAGGTVLLLGSLMVSLLEVLFLSGVSVEHPAWTAAQPLLPALAVFVSALAFFGTSWHKWIWLVLVIVFFAFGQFVVPLFRGPQELSYREKLRRAAQREREEAQGSLVTRLRRLTGPGFIRLVVIMGVAAVIANMAGEAAAVKGRDYQVIPGGPDLVVLRIYGGKVIAAPFDRATKRVERRLVILNVDNTQRLEFRLERVGPLKLASS